MAGTGSKRTRISLFAILLIIAGAAVAFYVLSFPRVQEELTTSNEAIRVDTSNTGRPIEKLIVGQVAPGFELTDTQGYIVSLAGNRGKIVVINILILDCRPCDAQVVSLKSLQSKVSSFEITTVSVDVQMSRRVEELGDYRDRTGASWNFAVDTDNVAVKYGVEAAPTLFVVDRDGKIAFVHVGPVDSGTLLQIIQRLR